MVIKELNILKDQIGNSVHYMNTIAIALSELSDQEDIDTKSVNVSWKPSNLEKSKKDARRYSNRSAIVYCVESFFEFYNSVKKQYKAVLDMQHIKEGDAKADKVYNFLLKIDDVDKALAVFIKLSMYWRNKIIHKSSNNKLTSEEIAILRKNNPITEGLQKHNYSVDITLQNFDDDKVTLKDASTLSTLIIRSAEYVGAHIVKRINEDKYVLKNILKEDKEFQKIRNYSHSDKAKIKERKIRAFFQTNYAYIHNENIQYVVDNLLQ